MATLPLCHFLSRMLLFVTATRAHSLFTAVVWHVIVAKNFPSNFSSKAATFFNVTMYRRMQLFTLNIKLKLCKLREQCYQCLLVCTKKTLATVYSVIALMKSISMMRFNFHSNKSNVHNILI